MAKHCKTCKKNCIGEYCFAHRPRIVMKTNKLLRPRKRMKQMGKVAKTWLQVRRQWFTQNPAAIYYCFYCGKPMERAEVTLDHKLSRSRRPDLRYDDDNLVPCCSPCNTAKGSMSSDEYLKRLDEMKARQTNGG